MNKIFKIPASSIEMYFYIVRMCILSCCRVLWQICKIINFFPDFSRAISIKILIKIENRLFNDMFEGYLMLVCNRNLQELIKSSDNKFSLNKKKKCFQNCKYTPDYKTLLNTSSCRLFVPLCLKTISTFCGAGSIIVKEAYVPHICIFFTYKSK